MFPFVLVVFLVSTHIALRKKPHLYAYFTLVTILGISVYFCYYRYIGSDAFNWNRSGNWRNSSTDVAETSESSGSGREANLTSLSNGTASNESSEVIVDSTRASGSRSGSRS